MQQKIINTIMKHSKAPWFTSETGGTSQSFGFGYRIENVENDTYLAYVNGVTGNETCKANAKLMASAPELLETLVSLKERLDYLIGAGRIDINKM